MYDSKPDTLKHIKCVGVYMDRAIDNLTRRKTVHDQSKLGPVEKPLFDKYTPLLRSLTYGTDEYNAAIKDLGLALQHHYAWNDHHPEHYANGVLNMSLLSIIEMLCDWKAATLRHADGDFAKSMEINKQRFGISDELFALMTYTALELGLYENGTIKVTPNDEVDQWNL